jgi:predicted PurR-regulated permease PerM
MYTLQRYRRVGFAVFCGLLAVAAFYVILPFWQAIAWSVSLAILVNPIFARLQKRMNDTAAAGLTTLATLFFIIGPVVGVGIAVFAESNHLIAQLRANSAAGGSEISPASILDGLNAAVKPVADALGAQQFDLKDLVQKTLSSGAGSATQLFGRIVHACLTFVFALLLLFFLLRDGRQLRGPAVELIPLPRKKAESVLNSIANAVHATFIGVVLISMINGVAIGSTFYLLGLPAPLLAGIVTMIFSFVPIAGAPLIYLPTAGVLIYLGQWGKAIAMVCVGSILVSLLVDKIYRSFLIGSKMDLHPMAVFFALLGGIFTLGPVGMIAGPVVLIVLMAGLDVFRELEEEESF